MKKILLIITILTSSNYLYLAQTPTRSFLDDSVNKTAIAEFEKLNSKQRRIIFKRLKDLLSLIHMPNEKHSEDLRKEIKNLERRFAPNIMKLINEGYIKSFPYFLENINNIQKVNKDASDYNPFNDEAWLCDDSKTQVKDINQNLFNLYEYFVSKDPTIAQDYQMYDKKIESIGYSRLFTSQQ